jgi:small subunit ribosomal protein S3
LGQKVHPLGFRLVSTQTHRSFWFSKFKDYPKLLKQDFHIREAINTKSRVAGISKIEISRNSYNTQISVTIHSARPQILVGKDGCSLKEIYSALNKIITKDQKIIVNVQEVLEPDLQAELIGDFIVEQLEKRAAFRRVLKLAIARATTAGAKGIKVQVAGRLNGAEIARTEWIREGRVPLQTLRADVDYASKQAHTTYGVLGIKVWIFRGEII